MVMKIQGGKVKNAWLFDQSMAFATQLGLMLRRAPAPVAAAPRRKRTSREGRAEEGCPEEGRAESAREERLALERLRDRRKFEAACA